MKRILLLAALASACEGDDAPPSGEELGSCYPNGTCNEGLVCASDVCVSLDGAEETEGAAEGGATPPSGSTTGADPESCAAQYLWADASQVGIEQIYGYIQCEQATGADGCTAFYEGCDHVAWTYPGCDEAGEVYQEYCGGSGPDDTTDPTSDPTADPTGSDDSGSDACPTPGCSSYASKLQSCYPQLDIDWYAECLNVYDICGSWECLPGTAQQVSCVTASSCDAIVDGACTAGDQC